MVKWKGYSTDEATWEPEDALGNVEEKVRKFNRKNRLFKMSAGISEDLVEEYKSGNARGLKVIFII